MVSDRLNMIIARNVTKCYFDNIKDPVECMKYNKVMECLYNNKWLISEYKAQMNNADKYKTICQKCLDNNITGELDCFNSLYNKNKDITNIYTFLNVFEKLKDKK